MESVAGRFLAGWRLAPGCESVSPRTEVSYPDGQMRIPGGPVAAQGVITGRSCGYTFRGRQNANDRRKAL